ncbi:hypothetical protein MycrhN_3407 [Mycolicibacterium rhodesiae NBB3]|uniref:Uncharacterized protein n=1 Tax=Mycolicibacterium rhodesiae (strain NBB3) TaxID=710685 RepID=G8RR05_MYCRN|nr:DUF6611 family protein [Mycolicibacterium rhodesiae]AEV73930.1 hypothetical protein MycrhN_3407 [Mycolicibacterium rhodesiae NBB3]
MSSTRTRPGLLRRGWQRALDGERLWGSVEIRPDRFGVKRYRLAVYPPGMNAAERRRVRVARGWPLWGAAVWILTEIALSQSTGPWTALAISTAAVLSAGAVTMVMAGEPRRRIRTMHACSMAGFDDPVTVATVKKIRIFAGRLLEADDALNDARLTPAEHEMLWWRVYDEVGAYQAAAACA